VYKLRSSSLCSLLQPPATSSLTGINIYFNTGIQITIDNTASTHTLFPLAGPFLLR
jgi:hypothetical protein